MKLVQVIDPHGLWGDSPKFDGSGDLKPNPKIPKGTRYPGYCEAGGRGCDGSIQLDPITGKPVYGDPHIIDQPDWKGVVDTFTLVTCAVAVCGNCGTESILGCVNYKWYNYVNGGTPNDETIEIIEPSPKSKLQPPSGCVSVPGGEPGKGWGKAEKSWKHLIEREVE